MRFRAFGPARHGPSLIGSYLCRWCNKWVGPGSPTCRLGHVSPTNLGPGPGLAAHLAYVEHTLANCNNCIVEGLAIARLGACPRYRATYPL